MSDTDQCAYCGGDCGMSSCRTCGGCEDRQPCPDCEPAPATCLDCGRADCDNPEHRWSDDDDEYDDEYEYQ